MSILNGKLQRRMRAMQQSLKDWCADTRGNVMMMSALAMPVMLGMAGLALEGGNWYHLQRKMQNAADAAAIAAAANATSGGYLAEARAVAATYGFTNGVNNTTVTANNGVTCPAGGNTCFKVTISNDVALIFSNLIGYAGTTTVGGAKAVSLSSQAIASQGTVTHEYCLLALATSGDAVALETSGAPNADFTGCSVASNSSMDCNGHNLKAVFGDAHGSNSGCGFAENENLPLIVDPYSGFASNIPSNTCTGYAQTTLSGSYAWTGNQSFCGNVKLSGNVVLTGSTTTLIIYNGNLDLFGFNISTANGATATIVFAGTNNAAYGHAPIDTKGGGSSATIDIQAPTSGAWSGVALYQAPNLTQNVSIYDAGNDPTWNITGLIYLPKASVEFRGAVNKSAYGAQCTVLVVDNVTIKGTASILANGGCPAAGLAPPQNFVSGRGKLVG